jgi:hypothetical protein
VVVTGVSAVLMGIITVGIHHLLKSHQNLRDASRNGLVQQRLTTLFRRDCLESTNATATENGIRFVKANGKTVVYDVDDNVVHRTWTSETDTGRDRFYSTREWTCKIRLDNNQAQLTLRQSVGGSKRTLTGTPRQMVVKSHVGVHAGLADSLIQGSEKAATKDKQ